MTHTNTARQESKNLSPKGTRPVRPNNLEEALKLIQTVMDTEPGGIFIYSKDGRLVECNRGACDMYELSRDEMLDMMPRDFIHPDAYQTFIQFQRNLREKGYFQGESAGITSDGKKFDIEVFGKDITINGENYLYGTIRNIAQYKKTRTDLAMSQERLVEAQYMAKMGDFIWQLSTEEVSWSTGLLALLGHGTHGDLDYADILKDIYHPEDKQEAARWLLDGLSSNDDFLPERNFRMTKKDGQVIHVKVSGVIKSNSAKGATVFVTVQDITESRIRAIQLEQSQERYRDLVENMEDLVYRYEFLPTRRFAYVSPSASALTGYTPEDHYDDPDLALKLVHPDDSHLLLEPDHAGEEEIRKPMVIRWVKKDRNVAWIEQRNRPVYDESGQLMALEGIARDITEAHLAQKAVEKARKELAELNDQFKTTMEAAGIGTFRWDIRENKVQMDDVMMKLLHAEGDPNQHGQTMEYWANRIHPDDRERFKDAVQLALAGEKEYNDVVRTLLNDGTVTYMSAVGTVERDKDGHPVSMHGIHWDVTAEYKVKQAQQELAELHNRFEVSMEAANIGVWDWNLATDHIHWDDMMYKLYGTQPDPGTKNQAYKVWLNALHPEDKERAEKAMQMALAGEKEFSEAFRIVLPDGSIRHMNSVGTVHRDKEGNPLSMLGCNWDVTAEVDASEQRMQNKKLELQNKELEQFAYVASHDLQEPLRVIMSYLELLQNRYSEQLDERAVNFIDRTVGSARRMKDMVDDLLDYSRAGRVADAFETIDANEITKAVISDLEMVIEQSNASIKIEKLPTIQGNISQLRSLFMNLVGNAIKYQKQGVDPVIRISVAHKKDCYEFKIADNGIGMEMKDHDRVFRIFQRLHSRHDYSGTGIGLAKCQKIVERHQGKIWFESEPGKGTTFYFTIKNIINQS